MYIYTPDQLKAEITLNLHLPFSVQFVTPPPKKKTRLLSAVDAITRFQ